MSHTAQPPAPPEQPFDDGAVHFDAKDRPLRRDVSRLGAQLGRLLRELAPAGVYETVEAARLLARRRRRGDAHCAAGLEGLLGALPPARAFDVVRAFSAYFGVVNAAEQAHRLRRSLAYRRDDTAQPGSLRASAETLVRRGTTPAQVAQALAHVLVEPVFTAHPTEAVRRTLLKKDQRLVRALVDRFHEETLDPVALQIIDRRIGLEMASAWQTDEQLPGRPSVAEEVEHVLFYLSDVLFRVVPAVHEELERVLAASFGQALPVERPLVRFGSWVGGDMDGNPNVGADTIRATLSRQLELALRRYGDELRGLHEHLSQSTSRVGVDAALLARLEEYDALLPEAAAQVPGRYAEMPYRRLLWLMEARLVAKGQGLPGGYGPPESFRDDLTLIASSLARHAGGSAGLALVRRTLWRVDVFGFHLAALDVRQHAEVHRRAAGAVLGDPDFAQRPAPERTALLAAALARAETPPAPADDPTLDVFVALAETRQRYGARALGALIISMAQGADDALAVLLLARAAGCVDEQGRVPLDVVPLFETVDDLRAAPAVLGVLGAEPTYARHLAARGQRQLVMLGYSDSSKDGGLAASRVALDHAQRELLAVADGLGLALTFFHGRGGSIGRGGSKPRAALLAAPPRTLGGHARATEQGEVIAAKFGLAGLATRTLEVTLGAVLERSAGPPSDVDATAEQHAIAETLASASRAAYRALVHDDPDFPAFFRDVTPLDVIERMSMGSRPSRRDAAAGVDGLRAIPWVFSWAQCRAALPGWFGVGSGLSAAIATHGLDAVRRAVRDWPFLAVLVGDVEMVLAKSDLEITARYVELAGPAGARLFAGVREEHRTCVEAVLSLVGSQQLLDRDPTLQRSIRLRNPYVDPMSFLQVDLLRRWRAGDRQDPELERVLVQSVRGIARGLRNTG